MSTPICPICEERPVDELAVCCAVCRPAVIAQDKVWRRSGMLYAIRCQATRRIKIGMAKPTTLSQRIAQLRAMSPTDLEVLWVRPSANARRDEMALHTLFRTHVHHGEWFEPDIFDAVEGALRALEGGERKT